MGIDLGRVASRSTLQAGIRYALGGERLARAAQGPRRAID
jgi:hypothetical protein